MQNTSRNLFVSIGVTGSNGILGLLFYILSARFLGTADFGNLFLVLSIIIISSDIADFGLNSGIVNFVARHKDKESYQTYLRTIFYLKLFFGILAVIGLSVIADFLGRFVFQKPEITMLVITGSVGVLGQMLFSFSSVTFQALSRFQQWAFLMIGSNLLRLVAIIVLLYFQMISTENILLSFVFVPFLFFIVSLLFLPIRSFFLFTDLKLSATKILQFSSWVGITNLLWVFLSKADSLILGRFVSSFQLGIYGMASQLSVVVNQLISALATVLGPKFASFEDKKQMHTFLLKFSFGLSGLFISSFLLLPIAYFLLPLLLGDQFTQSMSVFAVLFCSGLLILLITPVHESLRYFFQKPQLFIPIYTVQLAVTLFGAIILLPIYGIFGMAYAILAGNIANVALSCFYYVRLLNK